MGYYFVGKKHFLLIFLPKLILTLQINVFKHLQKYFLTENRKMEINNDTILAHNWNLFFNLINSSCWQWYTQLALYNFCGNVN